MGIILSTDLISVADANITARSADANFPKVNTMDFWHLLRRFRAADVIKSDTNYLFKFNLTAAQVVAAIFLNHVNFDKVRIYGHASDLGTDWSTASFKSGSVSISLDTIVNRYKAYIPLTAFNYQWLAIGIPDAATAVSDYTTEWQIGTVCMLENITTLSKNMAYGYRREAVKESEDIKTKGGLIQRVGLSSVLKWRGSAIFGVRTTAQEGEMWTANNLDFASPIVFYENNGDTSKAYLCLRSNFYEGTVIASTAVRGNTIGFQEI